MQRFKTPVPKFRQLIAFFTVITVGLLFIVPWEDMHYLDLHSPIDALQSHVDENPKEPRPPSLFDVTLVIMFNTQPRPGVVELLIETYRRYFSSITITGELQRTPNPLSVNQTKNLDFHWIHCEGNYLGYFQYDCLGQVMKNVSATVGYFLVADDGLLSLRNLSALNLSRPWNSNNRVQSMSVDRCSEVNLWIWWQKQLQYPNGSRYSIGCPAFKAAYDSLSGEKRNILERKFGERKLYTSIADFIYVPARMSPLYIEVASHFRAHNVFCEIAATNILEIIAGLETTVVQLKLIFVSTIDESITNYPDRWHVAHRLKLSKLNARPLFISFYNRTDTTFQRNANDKYSIVLTE